MVNGNNILIVGAGLLGSMIASPLCAFSTSLDVPFGVTLVDFDKVEKRNSPGNLGVPASIGKNKADILAPVYEAAGLNVKVQRVRITEKNLWIVKGHTLIVGALDNVPSRQLLLQASQEYGIPYIDLGLSQVGGVVSWSHGDVVTMPFTGIAKDYKVSEEKEPACALVATRVFSALVTECAAISIFIYISGHDPVGIVYQDRGRVAENGDMVNWVVGIGDGRINTTARCITGTSGQKEVSDVPNSDK